MKLIYKLYLPLLLSCLAIMAICCTKNNKADVSYSPTLQEDASNSIAKTHINKAEAFYKAKIYDSAYYHYNASNTLFALKKDSLWCAYTLIKMSELHIITGDHFGGEAAATEALTYLKNKNAATYQLEIYNILGVCYKNLYQYNDALYYYKKSLGAAHDSLSKCMVNNNIANVYIDNKQYDKALVLLKNLSASDTVLHNSELIAKVTKSLGDLYHQTGRPNAIKFMKKALAIRQKDNLASGLLSSYLQLSKYYITTNPSLSKYYAAKGYSQATKINSTDDKLKALQLLISASLGKESQKVSGMYFILNDSVNKARMTTKNQFAKIKYDFTATHEENLNLKSEHEKAVLEADKNKLKLQFAILMFIFGLITVMLLYYTIRLKHRKAKIIEVYNTEKRISKKIHDELANDIFNVMSFAEDQDFTIPGKQEKLIQNLDAVYSKTRDISRENNAIDTGENFGLALKQMLGDYASSTINVMVINHESVYWNGMSKDKKITMYRILQEFMVNMKKHSEANIVAIKFTNAGKCIYVQYSDNGKGFDPDKLIYKNGLQNAENRILSIGGSITFENTTKGLKIISTFPV